MLSQSRALAALSLAATAALVPVAATGAGPAAAAAELALQQARSFVGQADSVEVRGTAHFQHFDPSGRPSTAAEERFTEEVVFPDRWHVRSEHHDDEAEYVDEYIDETIIVGEREYSRVADDTTELERQPWQKGSSIGAWPTLTPVIPAPRLAELFAALREPVAVDRRDGVTTLEVRVDLDALLARGEVGFLPEVNPLVLVVDDRDGHPVELRVDEANEDVHGTVLIVFERWNGDIEIRAPRKERVDRTPRLDEEEIAAYHGELYMPRAVPAGWVFGSARVEDVQGEKGCEQVSLDFADPAFLAESVDDGYLSLEQMPARCGPARPRGAERLVAGRHRGWIDRVEEDDLWHAALRIGDTTVVVSSDLDRPELTRILANLVPLDFDHAPAPPSNGG